MLTMLTLALTAQDAPLYPGKTYYLTPSFSASLTNSFDGDFSGGKIDLGLDAEELTGELVIGLQAGHGYMAESGEDSIIFPHLSLKGGWIFRPVSFCRLIPYGGISLAGAELPTLFAGGSADFHLYDHNYVYLDLNAAASSGNSDYRRWSLGFGLKRPMAIMRRVPPMRLTHTLSTHTFSPDGDGMNDTLEIILALKNSGSCKKWYVEITDHLGNPVIDWQGWGAPPEQISWDGSSRSGEMVFSVSDYRINIELEDKLGNKVSQNDYFVTDIFVENDENGQLRIRIPGILFSSGRADFTDLNQGELQKNEDIVTKLKTSLDKFPEYRILIEGYGNLLYWDDEERAKTEQEEVLIPLSRARAARIKDYLVSKGIEEERLDVVGRGGEDPLVPFGDEENRWKNRRVEFILLK